MKAAKIIGILLGVYVAIVVIFESMIGYLQPQSDNTIVITTTADGEARNRVVTLLKSDGKEYVAVNHWPRMWYYRLLDNPNIQVAKADSTGNYVAVPVEGAEHDKVQMDNPTGIVFRILTGFPPRYFLRLDPE